MDCICPQCIAVIKLMLFDHAATMLMEGLAPQHTEGRWVMQVHDQTLQLLKACALQLTVAKLAAYLQTTLANSRKSRR